MEVTMAIIKSGRRIETLEDWEMYAGPKSPIQWKDGRSAKEAARAWLSNCNSFPAEVTAVLASHPHFGHISDWEAEPEARLPFDKFAGEPRNSDLVIYANDQYGSLLVAVEAKADESFGQTVKGALAAASKRRVRNPRSNGVARIDQLLGSLMGHGLNEDQSLGDLRYQLLTATAGALCAAERAKARRSVLLVQEFVADATSDGKQAINAADLSNFVRRLSYGSVHTVESGLLYGPFTVPGAPIISTCIQFYIGKASRDLRPKGD